MTLRRIQGRGCQGANADIELDGNILIRLAAGTMALESLM
jgi:hypothetical protein